METQRVPFFKAEDFDFRAYAEEQLGRFNWGTRYKVNFASSPEQVKLRVGPITGRMEPFNGGCRLTATNDDFDYEARYLATVGLPFPVQEPPDLAKAVLRPAKQLARRQ